MNHSTYNLNLINVLADIYKCQVVPNTLQESLAEVSADEYLHYALGVIIGQKWSTGPSTHLQDGFPVTGAELSHDLWRGVVDSRSQIGMFYKKRTRTDTSREGHTYPFMRLSGYPLVLDRLSEYYAQVRNNTLIYEKIQDQIQGMTPELSHKLVTIQLRGIIVQEVLSPLYHNATISRYAHEVQEILDWQPLRLGLESLRPASPRPVPEWSVVTTTSNNL